MKIPIFRKSKRARKLTSLEKIVTRCIRKVYVRDLSLHLEIEAMRETIAYIKQNMANSTIFTEWSVLHACAIEKAGMDGLYMEFGVKSGNSIRELAKMTTRTVHGFDSFLGLPEDWPGMRGRKGTFNKQGKLPKVPANVILYPGWFHDTLPPFLQQHKEPVAYLHVDCDLYSSTKTILDQLADRIMPGTVIVFDEYFNHPNWQQHEYKAFQEFIETHGITYDYLGFLSYDRCVSVKINGRR